jgi:hypothetical protein
MIIYVPLLVALLGALLYGLSASGKVQELGRIMFFCGLLVFLFEIGSHTATLLR